MKFYSKGYFLLRLLLRIPHTLFYRKIKIIGKENVPKDKPIIFAPNHQNALMDPLAMLFSTPKQIVFLARGDIFKGKILIKFLTFLKILPVYRQHDGKAALKKNEAVFDESVDYLKHSGAFCLFPESIHNPHRNLLSLKKGIPRIAFMALKRTDYKLDIQIVPTGIYYEDVNDSHSYLQVQYGKPMSVSNYVEQIKENEQKAMTQLSKDMAPHIKPLIIDIEENENYELVEDIRLLYSDRLMKQLNIKINDENRFKNDQFLIKELSNINISEKLKNSIASIKNIIKQNSWTLKTILQELSIVETIREILLSVLFLPFAFIGGVINVLPFALLKYIRTKIIKDLQFTSSIKFVVGAIIMPVYFLLLSLIGLVFVEYYWALIVLLFSPVLSYISYYYFKKLRATKKTISYIQSKHKGEIENLKMQVYIELDEHFKGIS